MPLFHPDWISETFCYLVCRTQALKVFKWFRMLHLCECSNCLICVCVACPLPGLHGGEEMVWIRSYLFGQSLKLLDVLLDRYSSLHFCSIICQQIVYTVILLLIYSVILHSTSIACLSILGEGSILCCSFSWFLPFSFPVKGSFWGGLIRVKGLRTEDAPLRQIVIFDTGLYK